MPQVLIVTSNEKNMAVLGSLISQAAYCNIAYAGNGAEARGLMAEADFDLCVINTPLPDESGVDLACETAERCSAGVLLVVSASRLSKVSAQVEAYGVFPLSRPLHRDRFHGAVNMALISARRFSNMRQENQKLASRIEDIRIIHRAKLLLVSYLSLSEQDAHKFIEKQAMDLRVTKRKVAEDILRMYER